MAPEQPHDDKYHDWLILSTKRPNDEVIWYGSGFAGYTKNLLLAGRYTEAEARREERRVPHHLVAVHLSDAMSMATTWVTVANGTEQMARLRALCSDREQTAAGKATTDSAAVSSDDPWVTRGELAEIIAAVAKATGVEETPDE